MRTIEERILNVKGIDYIVREDGKIFSTRGLYDEANVKSANRVYVSQAKTTNENIDNWSIFKPADFIDVDY